MKFHRDSAVGSDQQDDAGFLELVKLFCDCRGAERGDLIIAKLTGVADGGFDVLDDIVRHVELPGRIVERLGIFDQRFVVQETLDRRTPEERAEVHLGGPLCDRLQDVIGITGRGGKAGVFKIIHPGRETAADFLGAMGVRDDREFVRVRFVNDRFHLFHRHLVLVDQLDDVDSGVGELFHLGASVRGTFHAPAKASVPGYGSC